MWRFRICPLEEEMAAFEFHPARFFPRSDPLVREMQLFLVLLVKNYLEHEKMYVQEDSALSR